MPNLRWKGMSNSATRRRIKHIHWTQRDKIGAVLLGVMVFLTAVISGWLSSNYHD